MLVRFWKIAISKFVLVSDLMADFVESSVAICSRRRRS